MARYGKYDGMIRIRFIFSNGLYMDFRWLIVGYGCVRNVNYWTCSLETPRFHSIRGSKKNGKLKRNRLMSRSGHHGIDAVRPGRLNSISGLVGGLVAINFIFPSILGF